MHSPPACLRLFFILLCFAGSVSAQNEKRVYTAARISEAPHIDGELNENCWKTAAAAGAFIQNSPNPGLPSRLESDIRFVYDDNAVYIGATLYDPSPDSILRQLGSRDEYDNNTDYFAVTFDAYNDQRNAFQFLVTAAGVQADARFDFDKSDYTWNAVWFSKVKISDKGWTVELRIPYSALRFPKKEVQQWGVNFQRSIRRYRENAYWNPVRPEVQGIVNQSGMVEGISHIEAPLRLSFMPYVSGYAENYNAKNTYSVNGGMDVKYGINESFTLDMTLIPDFGQTQSDNVVLNLSPFEVKYDERRYFFTEGTELFNKEDLFYSRRIGAVPSGYYGVSALADSNETVTKNPSVTKLYNATKFSGRTKKKTGIGIFNAITAPMFATLNDTISETSREVLTEPLTNYNVIVVDQALRKNSYVSIINTNVMRNGEARDANVTGMQFKLADKKAGYAVEGSYDVSQRWKPGETKQELGHRYYFRAARTSGRFVWEVYHRLVSDTFEPNDLGYQDRNNSQGYSTNLDYNIYKPFGRVLRSTNNVGIDYFLLYSPRHFTFFNMDRRNIFTFRNFMTAGFTWLAQPITNFDYFETRVPNRYYLYPRNYEGGGFISSDYRKRLSLDMSSSFRWFAERHRTITRFSVSPRWRVNDRLMLIFKNENEFKNDNVGYADLVHDSIVFGVRNINTITNTLTAKYIFNSTMSLSFRARHYWSAAEYKKYFLLNEAGRVEEMNYTGNKDINYNAFNIDMVFTWQFLPGSELSAVWKNSIYTAGTFIQPSYIEDVKYIFDSPQSNSFSLKLIWYIDYLDVRSKRREH